MAPNSARTVTTSIEFTDLIFNFLLQQPGVSANAAAHEFVFDVAVVPVAMLGQMLRQLNPGAQNGDARYIALVNAISARIGSLLSSQSISDCATSLGTLYTTGAFTPAQVVQATVNFYSSGSPQNFLTLIAALPAGAFGGENAAANVIASGIVNAVTAGTIGASLGIELLLVIGTQSTAALQSAAITFLAAAVANGSAIATNAGVSISLAVADHATAAASVVTMLAQLVFPQPTIASTVSFYIAGLVNGGQISALSAATAMAAGAHGATAAQQYAISGEIAGLGFFGSDPSTGGLVANAILAASGPTASELLNVIAGFVGQAGSSLQLGVGEALAALVTNGTLTVTQVGAAFFTSYVSGGVTTLAQLNTVIVGLLAGGSVAAAANLAFVVGFSQEPVSDIAAALSAAVSAHTITALQVVDLAANIGLPDPAAQTIIAPLLASGAVTGQAAVEELGALIGTTQAGNGIGVFSADAFMSVFDGLAGASTSATQSSMGIGLVSVIAAGKLSFSAAASGLQAAVGGPITLDQALTILISAAASSFSLAAGETIAALVAGNSTATQTAISDVEAAVTGGALTPVQGLTLLAGMVDGGAPAAAQAAADLLQARTISGVDIDNLLGAAIAGNVPTPATVLIIATTYPAGVAIDAGSHGGTDFAGFLIGVLRTLIAQGNFSVSLAGQAFGGLEMQLTGPGSPDALVGDTVSGPGIPAGTKVTGLDRSFLVLDRSAQSGSGTYVFTPPSDLAAEQQIVAAFPPATALDKLIKLLVDLGTAAGPTALGQTLFAIIENGQATLGDVLAQLQATGATSTPGSFTLAPLFALGSLAQTAATAPAGSYAVDPAAIENGVYATINTMFPPAVFGGFETNAQFVVSGVVALAEQGGLFTTTFFPVLVQLLAHDVADFRAPVGASFTALLNANIVTPADLITALSGAGITGTAAIVALAATIDATTLGAGISANITAQNQVYGAITQLVSLQFFAAGLKAAVKGLSDDVTGGYAETNIINEVQSGELTADQAIAALDNLLAPLLAQEGGDPNLAQWTHDIAYAWLAVKASEFIQGNYKITTNTDSAGTHQTIQVLDSPVNELFADLVGQNQNSVISGLGALTVLTGAPQISSSDSKVAYDLTSYIFQQAAAASPGTDPGTVLFGFQSARNFFIGGANLLAQARSASQDPTSIASVGSGLILHQGSNLEDYVNFASRVVGIGSGVNALVFGPGAAAYLGPLGLYAQAVTIVLSIGAVSDALGPRTTAGLKGWFDVQAQVAGLAGNIVAGYVKATADQYIKGGEGLGLSFADLFTGNLSALATDSANLGEALFTLSTGGFNANAVGGTFEDFGIAIADLFSGHPSAHDFAVLGPDLLKVMTSNVFIASALSAFENFGLNVWGDVINIVYGLTGDDPNKQPPPQPPPPPTITLPNGQTIPMGNDPFFVGKKAYQDPTSTSNYGTFYHGAAIDGYIANATVFVDTNANGVLDPGEYSTTTDASGNYALPQGISGTVIVTGGTDIATGLPLTMSLAAPSGATSVTALTTLVQQIADNNGHDVAAAIQQVNAAFGLGSSVDPTQINPIVATQAGSSGGAQLFAATAQAQNTLTLLNASGGSNSTAALAQAISDLSSGQTLDLTDLTTLTNIATSAGVDPTTAGAAASIASASNSAVQQQVASTSDPNALLANITAVSIATQGNAAQQLSQSIGNSASLNDAINNFTGDNLSAQINSAMERVGNLSPVSLTPGTGAVGAGQVVQVTLQLADPVTVDTTNGTPTLALNVNEVATYDAGLSRLTALVFDYTVQAGDNTSGLQTTAAGVALNGATITDNLTSNAADLSGAVSAVPAGDLVVDTIAPVTTPALLTVAGNGPATVIGIAAPTDPLPLTITITGFPTDGTIFLADGVTPVTAADMLTVAQFKGLVFQPTPGVANVSSSLSYLATDAAQNSTAGTVTLSVGPQAGTAPAQLSGTGLSDLLLTNNNNGALVLAEMAGGQLGYTQIGGLGPEWQFEGTGAFLGDGRDGFLLWNSTSGGIAVGEDIGGTAQYTVLPGIGPEWQFEGSGPFLGQPTSDFLLWNSTNGGIVVGAVSSGAVQYTQIGSVGSEWQFAGTGNYLGDGAAGFLMWNNNDHSIVIGEDVGGQAGYTPVGAIGSEWNFVGSGNFLGHGQDDFLIYDTNDGSVFAGEVVNGAAQFTELGGFGPEWQVVGTGNFDGQSSAEIMLHNTNGGLAIGQVSGGSLSYTPVGGVGPEWNLHASHAATLF